MSFVPSTRFWKSSDHNIHGTVQVIENTESYAAVGLVWDSKDFSRVHYVQCWHAVCYCKNHANLSGVNYLTHGVKILTGG